MRGLFFFLTLVLGCSDRAPAGDAGMPVAAMGGVGGGGGSGGGGGDGGGGGSGGAPLDASSDDSGGASLVGEGACMSVAPGDGALLEARVLAPRARAQALDAACDGSFVIAGRVDAEATFEVAGGTQTVTDPQHWIARTDADGELTWLSRIDAPARMPDSGLFVRALGDGGAAFAGILTAAAVFSPGAPDEISFADSVSISAAYAARYDAQGALLWAAQIGAHEETHVTGLDVAGDGTMYVALNTGFPRGTTVGPLALDTSEHALIALDGSGAIVRGIATTPSPGGECQVKALADGSVLFYGNFTEAFTLARDTPGAAEVGPRGAFVARFDAELQLQWVKVLELDPTPNNVGVFQDGSFAVMAQASEPVMFARNALGPALLMPARDGVAFVARYDSTGEPLWATQVAGRDGSIQPWALAPHGDGSIALLFHSIVDAELDAMASEVRFGLGGELVVPTGDVARGSVVVARIGADGAPRWGTPIQTSALYPNDFALEELALSADSAIVLGHLNGTLEHAALAAPLSTDTRSSIVLRFAP